MKYAFILSCIALLFVSCSPKINYKLLSSFFDGVPNPDVADSISQIDSPVQADENSLNTNIPEKPQFIFHYPYLEKECSSCHDQDNMAQYVEEQPELCYVCHENFADRFSVLHAPVEGGECTNCHSPHLSKNEKLLTRVGQDLCLECHDFNDVKQNEIHTDIGDMNCTECHNPHGGDDRFILN